MPKKKNKVYVLYAYDDTDNASVLATDMYYPYVKEVQEEYGGALYRYKDDDGTLINPELLSLK